jgi:hypothetical protein
MRPQGGQIPITVGDKPTGKEPPSIITPDGA